MSSLVKELLSRASDEAGIGWTPTTIIPVPARLLHHAADRIEQLEADNTRIRIENIQMQAALGYAICAEDERHIIPSNPFKCGMCDARARAKKDAPA